MNNSARTERDPQHSSSFRLMAAVHLKEVEERTSIIIVSATSPYLLNIFATAIR